MRCKRKTPKVNPTCMRTKINRIVMRSMCTVSGSTKTRFMSRKKSRVLNWVQLQLVYHLSGRYACSTQRVIC